MKIIKKLCIPLLSLVLVLSCFSVSQMDASAAMSANDHIGPGSNRVVGEQLPSAPSYPEELVNVSCRAYVVVTEDNADGLCRCSVYRDRTLIYPGGGPPFGISGYCENCGHHYYKHTSGGGSSGGGGGGSHIPSHGGSHVPSHTHNYSTTWGAWRKISSCRLPG